MSAIKEWNMIDKKDLECSLCLENFTEPKTLECFHTYCLICLESLLEKNGHIQCHKCQQQYQLKNQDIQNLTTNVTINYLLEYLKKTESEKPTSCEICKNPPVYNCSECALYMCGNCTKLHMEMPLSKDHQLYKLKENDEKYWDGLTCPAHCEKTLELFCKTCNTSACNDCRFIFNCVKYNHKIISVQMAMDDFNKKVTEYIKTIDEIKRNLNEKLDKLTKDKEGFDHHLKLSRTAVEIRIKNIIKNAQEAGDVILKDLENLSKEKHGTYENQLKSINPKLSKLNEMSISVKTIMNRKPEEKEIFKSHEETMSAIKNEMIKADFDKTLHARDITPKFIPFKNADEVMNAEGIGIIATPSGYFYNINEEDREITVTKAQTFIVNVSSLIVSDACHVAATLKNPSGEKSTTDITYQENGIYKIKGKCNVEGDWQMYITARQKKVKGSPVKIRVEPLGLLHTIHYIQNYKEHDKQNNASDVMLDNDGCLLVSSRSKDLLKFDQSGLFVGRTEMPRDAMVDRMHRMNDGRMLYSDAKGCVVMCDDDFKEIRSFGKGVLKDPLGLAVNNETRILYVADRECSSVFKFNVDDGRMVGKIGSHAIGGSQEVELQDVAVTKDGHLIVAECKNSRILMFDSNEKFVRTLVGCGKNDGNVISSYGITLDMNENIIISSNHKIQLFDKNGKFIKRINHDSDRLNKPFGISVISKRAQKVAVANCGENNVKIFNY